MKLTAPEEGMRWGEAGGHILVGVCFYIMTTRYLRKKFGYETLVTDSAKLANIISGYGYNPVFRSTQEFIEEADTGKVK